MCGITGWIEFGRDLASQRSVMEAMTAKLRSRGPDSGGTWIESCAALGHRRLAVIDPAGGRQPMTADTADGPVAIVFSGEVYNFVELRSQLRSRGQRFKTSSDTEVVLRGYLEWGEGLASRLNGMFAFAIWDTRRQRLVMVRDRLGVKPLFYQRLGDDGLLFGSEPKAILTHPGTRGIVNLAGLRRMLGYVVTIPGVAWSEMSEVEPGDVVTFDRSGLSSRAYWRLTTQEHLDDEPTTVARTRSLLEDIVGRQLVADVPVGMLLSGGLDSSTITGLAARTGLDPIDTYEVDFAGYGEHFVANSERADPDAPYVAEVVAHLRARHRTVMLNHADVADPDLRHAVVQAYDVPPGSQDRDRSLLLLFRAIGETSTVALSGESADELFGGYASFHDPRVQSADTFPWTAQGFATYAVASGALTPEIRAVVDLEGYVASRYAEARRQVVPPDGDTAAERRMRVICHTYLTQSLRVLLDRKDRTSMATGVEVRVPYCDHRLVEYVYNVPWSMKTFDGREKSLLRAAASDTLPRSVLTRVKTAYPTIPVPEYVDTLRYQAAELSATRNHDVFAIVHRPWLDEVAQRGAGEMSPRSRNTLEWVLNLAAWLEVCKPVLRLP